MFYWTARRFARHAALEGVSAMYRLAGRLETRLKTSRVQFLLFHDIPANSDVLFQKLISHLARTHRFVSYSEAVETLKRGQVTEPTLCVSFDDGLYSGLAGARVLSELGIQACFFVCPAGLDASTGLQSNRFCGHLQIAPTRLLSWKNTEELLSLGHEIGGHSLSHRNLAQLSESEVRHDIEMCRSELQRRLGQSKHFAWPFGTFEAFSPAAARAVFSSGFVSCASGVRGCHTSTKPVSDTSLCIRRDNLEVHWPQSHVEFFLARNAANPLSNGSCWPSGWLIVGA